MNARPLSIEDHGGSGRFFPMIRAGANHFG
jgi:hypothetical protein